jgi:hypothetical protein
MAESLIQKYLDAHLFDIGEEDDRLGHFQKAADDLAKIFADAPQKLIPAILTAIDPNISESEPLLIEAENAVKTHWKAFPNAYPQRPATLLRPVLLDALAQRCREDVITNVIVWLAGSSLFERVEQTAESAIVHAFLLECGQKTEAEAEKEWAPTPVSPEFAPPKPVFKFTAPKASTIDKGNFKKQFQQHNSGYNSPTFDVSSPIADAIDAAVAPLYESSATLADQLRTPMKEFAKEFTTSLNSWINSVVGSFGARTNLLWWKQALYSPSLKRSYRGLSGPATVIVLAEDLDGIIGSDPAPQSVECFLRETVADCLGDDQRFSLEDLLNEAKTNTVIHPALNSADLPSSPTRICLSQAVQAAPRALPDRGAIRAYLGISNDFKLPVSEWAVWLFRDAQALGFSQALIKK